jgi:hypothetical protein
MIHIARMLKNCEIVKEGVSRAKYRTRNANGRGERFCDGELVRRAAYTSHPPQQLSIQAAPPTWFCDPPHKYTSSGQVYNGKYSFILVLNYCLPYHFRQLLS